MTWAAPPGSRALPHGIVPLLHHYHATPASTWALPTAPSKEAGGVADASGVPAQVGSVPSYIANQSPITTTSPLQLPLRHQQINCNLQHTHLICSPYTVAPQGFTASGSKHKRYFLATHVVPGAHPQPGQTCCSTCCTTSTTLRPHSTSPAPDQSIWRTLQTTSSPSAAALPNRVFHLCTFKDLDSFGLPANVSFPHSHTERKAHWHHAASRGSPATLSTCTSTTTVLQRPKRGLCGSLPPAHPHAPHKAADYRRCCRAGMRLAMVPIPPLPPIPKNSGQECRR
jgi:hypothetical protein